MVLPVPHHSGGSSRYCRSARRTSRARCEHVVLPVRHHSGGSSRSRRSARRTPRVSGSLNASGTLGNSNAATTLTIAAILRDHKNNKEQQGKHMCYPSSEYISPNPVWIKVKVIENQILISFGTAMPASGQHYHQNLPTKSSILTHIALTSFRYDLGRRLAEI